MLTDAQKEILRNLRSEYDSVEPPNRKTLAELGIKATDLTPEFLLASEPTNNPLLPPQPTTLQLLTINAYLPQIPPECLTPGVVFEWKNYPYEADCEDFYEANFLLFCAERGFYDLLPEEFQTKDAILNQPRLGKYTPLHVAAQKGNLDKLPLKDLVPGDLYTLPLQGNRFRNFDEDILFHSVFHEQCELIAHLVDPAYISNDAISACFRCGHFPGVIFKEVKSQDGVQDGKYVSILKDGIDLTAEKMLDGEPEDCPLRTAAHEGHLDKVDPRLFIHECQKVKNAIPDAKAILSKRDYLHQDFTEEEAERRAAQGRKWLVKVVQLMMAGAPPKR